MNVNKIYKKQTSLYTYAAALFSVPLIYIIFRAAGIAEKAAPVKWFICLSALVALVKLVVLAIRKEITSGKLICTVIFLGVILRMGYTLLTGALVRSHDIGDITPYGTGHAGYILWILTNGKLPGWYANQLYQQPLFYALGAGVSAVINGILGTNGHYELVDAAKTVSCMASCAMLFLIKPICGMCGLKDKGTLAAVSLTAFTPSLILAGGRVSPDMLAAMFMTAAIFYTFKLYKDRSLKNFLMLAVIYGLGVQTKISCGIVAVFTAVVFAVLLCKANREGRFVDIGSKLIVFAIVSLPLGLWYSIRNFVKFGMPLTYVPRLGNDTDIYVGDHSVLSRFFLVDLENLFSTPYADPWTDFNLPVYLQKTALFGEFQYTMNDFIPVVLLFCGCVISVIAGIAVIKQLISSKKNAYTVSLSVLFLLLIISTVIFNINYPHGCSMDFRYIIVLLSICPPIVGKTIEDSEKMEKSAGLSIGLYGVFSVLFIIFI